MVYKISLILFFIYLAPWGLVSARVENRACIANEGGMEWVYPAETPSNSVTVVVHGFNLRPDRMKEIVGLLNSLGSSVVNVTLSGHQGDYGVMRTVKRSDWLMDLHRASREARRKADEIGAPLYYVGMSLGALMHMDMLREKGSTRFDKRVLLSPAISVRWYTHLIRGANVLPYNIDLFTKSHEEYRVYDELPISAYNALFEAYEKIHSPGKHEGWNIPTLVFVDKKDFLIDFDGIYRFIDENELTEWEVVEIDNEKSVLKPNYHHLQVDSTSMGSEVWSLFTEKVVDFFGGKMNVEHRAGKSRR